MNIIESNTAPQNEPKDADRERMEKLYFLIQKRVKRSFLIRRLASVDDVTGDIFLLLVERELPNFESEEFERLLTKTANRIVRRIKRSVREILDINELGENEHPFYEMNLHSEDEDFESVFAAFCESFPEPKRTVFAKSRVLPKKSIAELTGLGRNTVAQEIKAMPELFRDFLDGSKTR